MASNAKAASSNCWAILVCEPKLCELSSSSKRRNSSYSYVICEDLTGYCRYSFLRVTWIKRVKLLKVTFVTWKENSVISGCHANKREYMRAGWGSKFVVFILSCYGIWNHGVTFPTTLSFEWHYQILYPFVAECVEIDDAHTHYKFDMFAPPYSTCFNG